MVGKTGVVGVMAEKLLSITAAAAALPAGLNYEKHTATLLLSTGTKSSLGDNVTSDPDTRNQRNGCSLWQSLRYTPPVKYGYCSSATVLQCTTV